MFRTNAVIIARTELGEADRLLDALTERFGRVSLVARGARRAASKLNAHAQLFDFGELMFVDGKRNKVLTSAYKERSFADVRMNPRKYAAARNAVATLGQFSVAGAHERPSFLLMREFLHTLDGAGEDEIGVLLRRFEFGLLRVAGVAPAIDSCVGCGAMEVPWALDVAQGGRVCGVCVSPAALQVSPEAASLLAAFSLRRNPVLPVSGEALQETSRLLRSFLSYHIDVSGEFTR